MKLKCKIVIGLVKQAKSYRIVQEVKNIFTTIGAIVKKYRLYDSFETHTGRGGKLKTTPRDDRVILKIVKKKIDLKLQKI